MDIFIHIIYLYLYAYRYLCPCLHVFNIYTHTYIHVYIYTCTYMYISMRMYLYTCRHEVYMYKCTDLKLHRESWRGLLWIGSALSPTVAIIHFPGSSPFIKSQRVGHLPTPGA